jgi:hypothetical protein
MNLLPGAWWDVFPRYCVLNLCTRCLWKGEFVRNGEMWVKRQRSLNLNRLHKRFDNNIFMHEHQQT